MSDDGRVCYWDDFDFLLEPDGNPIDGWVVYESLDLPCQQDCPPSNTLFISGEPASLKTYRSKYTSQFGQVWTSHKKIRHEHCTLQNESQPWHYGMNPSVEHGASLNFDDLVHLEAPEKRKSLSVICSGKALTPDHLQRMAFVEKLKKALGDEVDVFGRDTRPVEDKADAIYPYRYHVVLENDHSDYFMTEKLPDAFLGWSYPIYFGGSEARRQFPRGSFDAIDIYQPKSSIEKIKRILAADLYQDRIDEIAEARQQVLFHGNLVARLASYWKNNLKQQPSEQITLYPKSARVQLFAKQIGRLRNRWLHRNAAA